MVKKIFFVSFGFIFFGLGAIGIILPGLPTTPFLLASAYCFAKGSNRINQWFLNTKVYQNHLDTFVQERAMTLRTKVMICGFASFMLLIAFFMMKNLYGRVIIICVLCVKYYYFIFKIRTIKVRQS